MVITESHTKSALPVFLFDFALYYCAWYLLLVSSLPISASIIFFALIFRFFLVNRYVGASRFVIDCAIAFTFVIVGFFVETLFLVSELLNQSGGGYFPPVWLLGLWWVLGWVSLSLFDYFRGKLKILAGLSLIFAPASYYFGCKLQPDYAVGNGFQSFFLIGVVWAFVLPLILRGVFLWLRKYSH